MKIVEQTPGRMKLRDRGWSLWLTFLPMALIGLGIMPLGRHTIFSCQRASTLSAQCTLEETNFLVSTRRPIPPSSIHGAVVKRRSSGRGSVRYSVILRTKGQSITISSRSSSWSRQEAIANRVNAFFMDNTQPSLYVENDDRVVMLFIGGITAAMGIGGLLGMCEINHATLDKASGKLHHVRQGAIGQKESVLPLHQVAYADVEQGTGKARSTGRIVLHLKSGDRFPLTRTLYPGLRHKEKVARLISEFVAAPSPQPAVNPERAKPAPVPSSPEAAIAQYQQALQTNPDDAETHYRLGMVHYKQHDVQAAATHLNRARDLFAAKHESHRVLQVQDMLWRLEQG
ncbi:tetratricopeptide repeat protein [Leptolyngbya sp. O-77]|uniref:tetratricopeptide repeat protein n=1 Tax=Leptolyngbya sp. O-77 TaxID=1080068 RepID=UPI00074D37D2|nr:tetratricopeptide repeat protein [Leptolyngbya sp. O-77]BAU44383.1 Tetratricopeptide repeat protein [Leptolyngbya sp. O-77]